MARLIICDVEDGVHERLRELARRHGRSMEEEVRDILRGAVMTPHVSPPNLGSRLAGRFTHQGLKRDIPEMRGQPIEAPSFDG